MRWKQGYQKIETLAHHRRHGIEIPLTSGFSPSCIPYQDKLSGHKG
jgi:hypothetical protein